jgi:hypothetical protein
MNTIPFITANIKGVAPELPLINLGKIVDPPCKLPIKFSRPWP